MLSFTEKDKAKLSYAASVAKDILTVLEGPIACVTCLEDPVNKCPRFKSCPTISFYEGLNKLINDYLETYTLEDLIKSNDLASDVDYK